MKTTRQSNFAAGLRTTVLMAGLTGLLVVVGYFLGGPRLGLVALALATLFNFATWFFSGRIALRMSRAKPVSEQEAPQLYEITRELAARAELPMPKLYVIPQEQPNAFATGRNPKNAAVAVTAGLLQRLPENELRGVIAHELAHIRNRDILIQSVAATIGGAITFLAELAIWFGDDDDSLPALLGSIIAWVLAPLAATLIQMAISRQREYSADATGAQITGDPESLASALERLEASAQAIPMKVADAAEPLYIVKPFRARGLKRLFSTHPPIPERVQRLRQMRPALV
jgi:heat shock protein HtpX